MSHRRRTCTKLLRAESDLPLTFPGVLAFYRYAAAVHFSLLGAVAETFPRTPTRHDAGERRFQVLGRDGLRQVIVEARIQRPLSIARLTVSAHGDQRHAG